MPVIPCALGHAINLVLTPETLAEAFSEAPRFVPRYLDEIVATLNGLATFGVATRLGEKDKIFFYTPTYVIGAKLTTKLRDAYVVRSLRPLTLRDHTHLCRRALSVRAASWHCHPSFEALSATSRVSTLQSGYDTMSALWEQLASVRALAQASQSLSTAQQTFLDTVDQIIDAGEQLEREGAWGRERLKYRAVEAVAVFRSVGDTYAFRFDMRPPFEVRQLVRITADRQGRDGPGYIGSVLEITGPLVTVRFQRQLDLTHIPASGVMQEWYVASGYAIKRAAVVNLRSGLAKNPHLLHNVSEGHFAAYQAPTCEAGGDLNAAQRTALARAEIVPDMLLVLGPPGTGKTHTIQAMVLAEAKRHGRVLISSQSNTAVDNVLKGLVDAKELRVVRVGKYDRTADKIKGYLIDEQARALQAECKERLVPVYRRLSSLSMRWGEAEKHLAEVDALVQRWREALTDVQETQTSLAAWHADEARQRMPGLSRVAATVRRHHTSAVREARRVARWARRIDSADRLRSLGIGSVLPNLLVALGYRQYRGASAKYTHWAGQYQGALAAYIDARDAYWHSLASSDEAILRKAAYAVAEERAASLEGQLERKLAAIARLFGQGIKDAPAVPPVLTPDAVEAFVARGRELQAQVTERHDLLDRWWNLLEYRHQALYPALIQSADVVGATCLGIATDMRFDDLDFHLAIVDEAGQIAVDDLLVPLARANRAVLVGDHKQLPPVVKQKLEQCFNDAGAQRMVKTSLFELLFPQADAAHTVLLDTQYRLPRLIADFVKDHIYDGRYATARTVPYRDAIFTRPLVFIDTRWDRGRREVPHKGPGGEGGFVNQLEAELIVKLVECYVRAGVTSLGVIVPYRAQVELIRELVHERGPTLPADPQELIATVDSFQGQQREVIILGFTRSNSSGRVGFLCEWRRLNVSITRAMRQLVLIGDGATLTRASDATAECDGSDGQTFARLASALIDYSQANGEYLRPKDVRLHP